MALTPFSSRTPELLTQHDLAPPPRRFSNLAISALGIGALIAAVLVLFYELSRPAVHVGVRSAATSAALQDASPEFMNASDSPSWAALSVTEKAALYPLAGEWARLGSSGQAKWLAIADRFPSMTQAERERTQQRMSEWAKLTPEQRRVARDSYLRAHALPPEKRAELLQKYQELPDQEKEHLAAIAREHHSVVSAIKGAGPKTISPCPVRPRSKKARKQPVPGVSVAARLAPGSTGAANNLAGTTAATAAAPGLRATAAPAAPVATPPSPAQAGAPAAASPPSLVTAVPTLPAPANPSAAVPASVAPGAVLPATAAAQSSAQPAASNPPSHP